MPNWTFSTATFDCTPKRFAQIAKKIKGKNGAVDFNKIIKMPTVLTKISACGIDRQAEAVGYYLSALNPESYLHTDEVVKMQDWDAYSELRNTVVSVLEIKRYYDGLPNFDTFDKVTQPCQNIYYNESPNIKNKKGISVFAYGKLCTEAITTCGQTDWYNWAISNWGTKWNAGYPDVDLDHCSINFETAWCTPYGVWGELAEMFPDVSFTVHYDDEDCTSGELYYSNGILKTDEYWERVEGEDEDGEWCELKDENGEPLKRNYVQHIY